LSYIRPAQASSAHSFLRGNIVPVVFVHGVNVRRGSTPEARRVFDQRVEFGKQQFREIAFKDRSADLHVFAPYWGDLGVSFARGLQAIPHGDIETLAVPDPENAPVEAITASYLDAELGLDADVTASPLLTLARRRNLSAAVNLLFAGASAAPLEPLVDEHQHEQPEAARLALAAEIYAEQHPAPPWLEAVADDDAFIERMLKEIAPPVAPGSGLQTLAVGSSLANWLSNAAGAVKSAAKKIVGVAAGAAVGGLGGVAVGAVAGGGKGATRAGFMLASRYLRPTASTFIGNFFGDVFTYMDKRDDIVARVVADIDKALAERDKPGSKDKELILVGHSFGGVILFDILTHFRADLECDLYVTVGSQVGLFAEMRRFANQKPLDDAFAAGQPAGRPANIARWLNVFDETDYVGFGVTDVFTGARDFAIKTDSYPILSHVAYFDTPTFHVRLRERVAEAFKSGT
jgi:hypothetical protein